MNSFIHVEQTSWHLDAYILLLYGVAWPHDHNAQRLKKLFKYREGSSAMFIADSTLDVFLRGMVLTTFAMVWIVILVRVNGLRSFSKMTNFDFVMTVAVGSLLAGASQSTNWVAFAQSLTAMAALFLVQYLSARFRNASKTFKTIVQNNPVVLMRNGVIITEALDTTRVAKDDLMAKLREANVLDLSQVRAVILETTGDVSVLHGDAFSEELLQGTRRIDR